MSTHRHESPWCVEQFDPRTSTWRAVSYELSERMARRALRYGGVRRYIPNLDYDSKSSHTAAQERRSSHTETTNDDSSI